MLMDKAYKYRKLLDNDCSYEELLEMLKKDYPDNIKYATVAAEYMFKNKEFRLPTLTKNGEIVYN